MKKVIGFSLLIILVLAGCGSKKENYAKTMEDYAQKYYDLHLSGDVNLTTYTLTIADLKEAITLVGDSYDMTKLEKCNDDSKTVMTKNNDKLTFETTMNCD